MGDSPVQTKNMELLTSILTPFCLFCKFTKNIMKEVKRPKSEGRALIKSSVWTAIIIGQCRRLSQLVEMHAPIKYEEASALGARGEGLW